MVAAVQPQPHDLGDQTLRAMEVFFYAESWGSRFNKVDVLE